MDPEYVETQELMEKSDIYSYDIVLHMWTPSSSLDKKIANRGTT